MVAAAARVYDAESYVVAAKEIQSKKKKGSIHSPKGRDVRTRITTECLLLLNESTIPIPCSCSRNSEYPLSIAIQIVQPRVPKNKTPKIS